MHRPMLWASCWALLLSVAGLGCWSQRKPPFAHSPVLLHYKPTLSDSATILAEMQARRGPQKPPMPSNGVEESAIEPANSLTPSMGEKPFPPTSDALPPLTEPFGEDRPPRPIIRASGQSSRTTELDRGVNGSDSVQLPDLLPPPPESDVERSRRTMATETVLPPPPPESEKESVPVVELPHGLPITVHGESRMEAMRTSVLEGSLAPTSPEDEPPKINPGSTARRSVTGSYGHDPDRRWLQGVLERHYRGYYCLRYCDPSVEDEFGGKVRLQQDERLGQFRDGDVIGVFGWVTEAAEVAPPYRIEDIWLVRPR